MILRSCVLILAIALALLPSSRAQTSPPPVPAKDDYSQEAAILEEMSSKIAFDNDGNSTRDQTTRVRVQTDAGVQQWGLLKFPYQSATQTVEIDYVRVHHADGSTLITPPDNVQDLDSEITRSAPFYSDLREKHVAVKGLGKGDILEYEVHWRTTKPLVPGQFWLQYNFQHDGIVLRERLEIKVPAERAVKVKGPQATQTVVTEAGSRIYAWTYSELKDIKDPENDQKKATETATGLLPPPDVQITSFQTWDEVGRWYWNLQKDRIEPTPAIRAKAAELTKGMTDDAAKLGALYNFVSTQYRYIGIAFGIGRYQPHAADDVLTNNYGDCKDKHTLLASLLQASGFTLYPALINSSYKLDPDIPSPAQFDHVIGYLPQARYKEVTWLDTTIEVAPFGYLFTRLRGKQALVMSTDKSIQLITTPTDSPFPNTEAFKIEGKLSDDGSFDAKVEDTTRGDSEVLLRAAFRQVPQPHWKDLVQQISYGLGYSGLVSDVTATTPEAIAEPFHFSYSYNRKDYPDWKSDHHFTVPGLPFGLPPVREDAKYPIWLGSQTSTVSDTKVEIPKGYTLYPPPNVDLKYDFAEYHASYSQDNGVLIARRWFLSKLQEVPVAEFDDYRNFLKKLQDDVSQYVQTNSAAGDLDKRGYEAVGNGNYSSAISLLKKAVEADPKSKTAWNDLGLAYFGLMQDDLAVEAYQKQIEIDPHHQYAFNNLGRVYLRQRKYEEAVKWFKKQIEIDPLDKYAHSNLGSAYLGQHKYQEAVPELEQAASLTPSTEAEMRLGSAYLQAGQIEKGTAVLQKVAEANPKPVTLNDIGYQLADANTSLPKALEYAQHAVDAQERESHDVELPNLLPEDLACTQKIGMFWDTLGWVHFRLGHLDQAESYIHAAWLLMQGAVEADHLAQIYEQQKKTEKAIHMYRLALAVPQAYPGESRDDTRHRLENLTGEKMPTAPDLLHPNSNGSELSELRTVKLKRLVPGTATAEFFLLFIPGPKLDDVKFISGSEKLKSAEDALSEAEFQVAFPPGSTARLVRRALVMCSNVSGCDAVLLTPDSVHSVN
ncbi:MAG: DUF3857 domain-containing protein [Terriglobales bacterium]